METEGELLQHLYTFIAFCNIQKIVLQYYGYLMQHGHKEVQRFFLPTRDHGGPRTRASPRVHVVSMELLPAVLCHQPRRVPPCSRLAATGPGLTRSAEIVRGKIDTMGRMAGASEAELRIEDNMDR